MGKEILERWGYVQTVVSPLESCSFKYCNIEKGLLEVIAGDGDIALFLMILRKYIETWASYNEKFDVVELGVRGGHSTYAILSALNSAKKLRSTYSEDWQNTKPSYFLHSCDILDCTDSVEGHIEKGLLSMWNFYKMDSIIFGKIAISDVEPNIIFMDTDHTHEQQLGELEVWAPRLKSGGRIFIHDTSISDVGEAIEDFLKDNPDWNYYNIDVFTGMGVLDKP
jgi:hypothetical protein